MRLLSSSAMIFMILCAGCRADQPKPGRADSEETFRKARLEMVQTQIEMRGVRDQRVLEAVRTVPRHRFVPDQYRDLAYTDQPLPIGEEQTISQPYIVGLMTELVQADSTDKVLEVGTGSGYQAAVLGELAREVYTIEIVASLAKRSAALLDSLGYKNIHVRQGDGFAGWPERAPFDAIVVTCAPPQIPQPLIDQLADDGRLVIPVGTLWQELLVVHRTGEKLDTSSVIPVRFVPMTGHGVQSQD